MFPETPRVPLNQAWARELKAFLQAQMDGAPAPEATFNQVQAIFQSGYVRDLGLLRYAEGAPLAEVRDLLRRSAAYLLEVFRLRENAPEDGHSSLTHSGRGSEAMELALACGALDLARAVAPLVRDPEDASYLGPDSVVCTPEEQGLAYALRDLLLGRPEESLAQIRALQDLDRGQSERAALLSALAREDAQTFSWALQELHTRHLDQVGHPGPLDTLEDLLDLRTLAFAAMGNQVFPALKPLSADPFLPLDLCRAGAEVP